MVSTIQQFLKEHGISEVEAIIPDMAGVARGKLMPAEKFAEEEGMRLPEAIFLQTVTGDYPEDQSAMNPSDIDIVLKADPKTVRVVPWAAEPTAQVIHDCFYGDGRPVTMAPRYVLRRVLDLYEAHGWEPVVAPELEFFLVEPNVDSDYPLKPPVGRSGRPEIGRQAYSIAAVNEFDPLFDDMYSFCEAQDIEIDTLIHEAGAAQMEINLLHGYPMGLADQAFLFKRTAREAAMRHKMYATFMAKPMAKEPGSAMHLHQSIIDAKTRKNIFSNPDGSPVRIVLRAYRRSAEISARRDVAVRSQREQLSAHQPPFIGAHQRALGLRQSHGGAACAHVRARSAARRESGGRRRRESLPRDRGIPGLRLSRHGRRIEALRTHRRAAPTIWRSPCRALWRRRCACCANRSRWWTCSATASCWPIPRSRRPSTKLLRKSSVPGSASTCS